MFHIAVALMSLLLCSPRETSALLLTHLIRCRRPAGLHSPREFCIRREFLNSVHRPMRFSNKGRDCTNEDTLDDPLDNLVAKEMSNSPIVAKQIAENLVKNAVEGARRSLSELRSVDSNRSIIDCELLPMESNHKNDVGVEQNENTLRQVASARASNILSIRQQYMLQRESASCSDKVAIDRPIKARHFSGLPKETISTHSENNTSYQNHPAITGTALAQSIWATVIRPFQDTVIDATCGNGKDSVAIARLMFPKKQGSECESNDANGNRKHWSVANQEEKPELICIDIQKIALNRTKEALLSVVDSDVVRAKVTLLHQSHASLPMPRDTQSIGLICYNLGYLPGGKGKEIATTVASTISSLAGAALMIRRGGLLSIMVYPGSNKEEAMAVEAFAEALGLLSSSKCFGGWRGHLNELLSLEEETKVMVRRGLERVEYSVDSGEIAWRCFSHKSLGRSLSPFLVTAMKIK